MDPIFSQDEFAPIISLVCDAAVPYLDKLRNLPVNSQWTSNVRPTFNGQLPVAGRGGANAISSLIETGFLAATRSNGPRFYNFVIGGVTPAALAADWLVSVLDQNVAGRVSSEYGTMIEIETIRWLLELCDLPANWRGVLVASATLANFTGLSCARQWWGQRLGFNVAEQGITQAPAMTVLSSGYVHPSIRKALQMLGHGRETIRVFSRDSAGRIDLEAMRQQLESCETPGVIVANAGEVNAGDFDPIEDLADLAAEFDAWLHIDAAFGIFARLSESASLLTKGFDRANSIAADAHKWLNVPYESGFCLVRDPTILANTFGMSNAPYIADLARPDAGFATLGPEASRRARALPIWASLAAYGKDGYKAMVNRHINLASMLADAIVADPNFELLAEVKLPIVCFRYHPDNCSNDELNRLNDQLSKAINSDGRFAIGATQYAKCSALRVAIFNWRITEAEIIEFINVLKEIAQQVLVDRKGETNGY